MKLLSSEKLNGVVLALLFGLLASLPFQAVSVQAASGTTVDVVPSSNALNLGKSFTVNLTISNVQNLYALDVAFSWNTSVLQVMNVNLRLGVESHSDGVLHENLPNYPINVLEDTLSLETGEYHAAATSVGPTDAFSGSGNIAILTFNVTSIGQVGFKLESELSDKLVSGEPSANLIEHTDNIENVSIIPEFPTIITVGLLLVFVTAAVVFSKKRLQHNDARFLN